MGREECLAGLRDFVEQYKDGPDYPVLQDFVASMRRFAPEREAFDVFTRQWFFDVVMPEYVLRGAEVTDDPESGEGRSRVTVTIENRGTGRATLELAATRGERFDEAGEPTEDYRESRTSITLGAGERAEVTIACDFEPEQVVVDPDALVLQLAREKAMVRF
jgi:hypothetical protein